MLPLRSAFFLDASLYLDADSGGDIVAKTDLAEGVIEAKTARAEGVIAANTDRVDGVIEAKMTELRVLLRRR